MFSIFGGDERNRAEATRLRRLEKKLDLVLEHLGISVDSELESGLVEEARRLADSGQKIAAIKAQREGSGADLVAAKEAVEAYMEGG